MSSLNSCEQYDCNEITGADLHTVYEEVTDADDDFACGTSGVSSCPNLESFCSKVQSNSDNVYQKKRAFSKVTLTRDRKRLKPIDGVVECLLLDGELPCPGDYNNVVII
jgi:hypothetical protein